MFKYLYKLLSFTLVLSAFLYGLDFIVTQGLKKNKSNVFVDWNRIYNGEIDANLIINGSSIAEVQISPRILDTILNVNSYNFGMSGFSFLMQKARYDVFLEHNKRPEIIIQIVGDAFFEKKQGLFQLPQFLPYLDDPIIRTATKQYEGLNSLDYDLPLLRYSGEFTTLIKGIGSFFNYEFLSSNRYKGFSSNDFGWDYRFEKFKNENPNGKVMRISSPIKKMFETYIISEKAKGTKLFIVFTPTYMELEQYILNRTEIISLCNSLAKKYDVIFLDYSNSEFTTQKELFYNASHLNKKGSELFSKKLALDIKPFLTNVLTK